MTATDHLSPVQFYHGTPDERTWQHGGSTGLHVGTHAAARSALEARIGAPATGEWDGSREYGATPLVSNEVHEGYPTGLSASGQPHHSEATYSNGEHVPPDAKPSIFGVQIHGPMTNTPAHPISDSAANRKIKRSKGAYYSNVGEDEGSVSAVVPAGHIQRA